MKDFPYCEIYEEVRVSNSKNKKKLLIISDSFGDFLFPLISENFTKTVKIFDNWEYKLNEKIVEIEKPNVVILLILESNLHYLINDKQLK